jgi:hypothetical protein
MEFGQYDDIHYFFGNSVLEVQGWVLIPTRFASCLALCYDLLKQFQENINIPVDQSLKFLLGGATFSWSYWRKCDVSAEHRISFLSYYVSCEPEMDQKRAYLRSWSDDLAFSERQRNFKIMTGTISLAV